MEYKEFHNALRIMMNIDRDEMERAKLIDKGDHNQWGTFRKDPFRWFLRMPDNKALIFWDLLKKRLLN